MNLPSVFEDILSSLSLSITLLIALFLMLSIIFLLFLFFLLLQALNYILTNGEALEQMLLHENNIEGMNMIESIRNNAMRSVMEREREERISSNTLGKLI